MRLIWLMFFIMFQNISFKQSQMQNVRVKKAYEEKEAVIKKYFAAKKLQPEGCSMFIRAFKKEQQLEVWVKEKNADQFSLLHTYAICSSSGVLGPKRKEGDSQVPEGIYEINHFNPQSNFHLSLGINYPNASDRILSDRKNPGSAIYIHGNCVTIGCIPLTDDLIKEVYVLAVEARNSGQKKIQVHIFPNRMDTAGMNELKAYSNDAQVIGFWQNLQTIYQDFQSTRKIRTIKVNNQGGYYFQP
jgi:murein L,D-transpeptidase YafK